MKIRLILFMVMPLFVTAVSAQNPQAVRIADKLTKVIFV